MDITNQAAIKAIKANLFGSFDYLGRSPQAEMIETPELKWLITGIAHPFINHVFRTRLTTGDVDARIGEMLKHFRSKGIPEFSWWVEPELVHGYI